MTSRPTRRVQCIHPQCKTYPTWTYYYDIKDKEQKVRSTHDYCHLHYVGRLGSYIGFEGCCRSARHFKVHFHRGNRYKRPATAQQLFEQVHTALYKYTKWTYPPPLSIYTSYIHDWAQRHFEVRLSTAVVKHCLLPFLG